MADDSAPLGATVIEHVESINFADGEMLVHLAGEGLRTVLIRMPALVDLARAFAHWGQDIAARSVEYQTDRHRN